MSFFYETTKKPNWLLRGLMLVSIAFHMLLLLHITGIYNSATLNFIEVTVRDISSSRVRDIPRPRVRPKKPVKVSSVKRLKIRKTQMLNPKRVNTNDLQDEVQQETMEEPACMPDIRAEAGSDIGMWDPGSQVSQKWAYMAGEDYYDMVRARIEKYKRYPQSAINRDIEGQSTVYFVIEKNGTINSLKVVKKAVNMALDKAALDAVRDAAPFPKPPPHLIKNGITLTLTIVFGLT